MTRKRFVKLLMADGYSRNDANEQAATVRVRKLAYRRSYYAIVFAQKIAGIAGASNKAAEAMLFAAKAIKEFADTAVKTAKSIDHFGVKTSILLVDDLEVLT